MDTEHDSTDQHYAVMTVDEFLEITARTDHKVPECMRLTPEAIHILRSIDWGAVKPSRGAWGSLMLGISMAQCHQHDRTRLRNTRFERRMDGTCEIIRVRAWDDRAIDAAARAAMREKRREEELTAAVYSANEQLQEFVADFLIGVCEAGKKKRSTKAKRRAPAGRKRKGRL